MLRASQPLSNGTKTKGYTMWMEQTFDWIFFAIVGLPVVYAIVDLYRQKK